MASIFTKIIRREIPAYIIYEDDDFIAFLDIFPTHEGQTLIVPKKEVPSKFSIVETDLLQNAVALAQRIATRIEEKLPEIERCILVIEGLEIDHLHIKLYPIKKNEKKGISIGGERADDTRLEEIKILLSDEQKS